MYAAEDRDIHFDVRKERPNPALSNRWLSNRDSTVSDRTIAKSKLTVRAYLLKGKFSDWTEDKAP